MFFLDFMFEFVLTMHDGGANVWIILTASHKRSQVDVHLGDDVDFLSYEATLPKNSACTLPSSWSMADPTTFLIRGKSYLKDRKKVYQLWAHIWDTVICFYLRGAAFLSAFYLKIYIRGFILYRHSFLILTNYNRFSYFILSVLVAIQTQKFLSSISF